MKYLKKFEGIENINDKAQWDALQTKLNKVLNILGFTLLVNLEKDKNGVEYTVFKILVDFNKVKFSILYVMSLHITEEFNDSILPIFPNSIPSNVSSVSIIVAEKGKKISSVKFKITPDTPEEAYNLIMNKLISIFENFDDKVLVSNRREPLTVKNLIIEYLKINSFNSDIKISDETIRRITSIIENGENGFKLMDNIKNHNTILYNRLNDANNELGTAADMGGMGF